MCDNLQRHNSKVIKRELFLHGYSRSEWSSLHILTTGGIFSIFSPQISFVVILSPVKDDVSSTLATAEFEKFIYLKLFLLEPLFLMFKFGSSVKLVGAKSQS